MAFIRQHMLGMAGDPLGLLKKGRSAGGGTKAKAARHRLVRFKRMAGDPGTSGWSPTPFGKGVMSSPASFNMNPKASAFQQFINPFVSALPGIAKGVIKAAPIVFNTAAQMGAFGPSKQAGVGAGDFAALQRRGAAPSFNPMAGFADPFAGVMGGGGSGLNKDGSPRRIRADGRPYKRPTLNALNPKALARAGRRFTGFKKAIRQVNASLPGGMKFEAPAARKSTGKRKR